MPATAAQIQDLDSTPVMGVSLGNVKILRLDKLPGNAPGNKRFKLHQNILKARERGLNHIVSFGGAWSNHLHALAATGQEMGIQTTAIVRGEQSVTPSAMLLDAKKWGMNLIHVSRSEYKKRDESSYLNQLRERLGPFYLVPEGGANSEGVAGCEAIAELLCDTGKVSGAKVVMATGTGTTLAGVARALPAAVEAVGISVLKNALDIDARVAHFTGGQGASWQVLHRFHEGGYAKVSDALKQFILSFESLHNIPLDPVYTGKALFAVHQLLAGGVWQSDHPVVFVHTGGLQGRRGFSWLL